MSSNGCRWWTLPVRLEAFDDVLVAADDRGELPGQCDRVAAADGCVQDGDPVGLGEVGQGLGGLGQPGAVIDQAYQATGPAAS
nr:hypothetical protein [Kribbella sp. VKM Ac-2571]